MKPIFFAILAFGILSCSSSVNDAETSDPLYGIWQIDDVKDHVEGAEYSCSKASKLVEKNAIIFKEPNIFQSWDYGWCGTPPVHYFLTEGTFSQQVDNLVLDIHHFIFQDAKIEILEVDENHLRFIMTR